MTDLTIYNLLANNGMSEAELCTSAANLASNDVMKIVLIGQTIACAGGLVTVPIVLRKRGLKWLVHHNTRLLFGLHIIFTLIVNATYMCIHIYDLIRLYQVHDDPCEYLLSFAFVFHVRIIGVFGLFGQIYTMSSIALERLYSTFYPIFYERTKSYVCGISLSICSIMASFVFTYGLLAPGVSWSRRVVTFTVRSLDNEDRYQVMIWCEVVPEILTILLFHGVLYMNYTIARPDNTGTLANKYQIEENKRVITFLLPVFYVHFVFFFITSFGLSLFYTFFPSGNIITHSIFLEIVCIIPTYGTVMPLILETTIRTKTRRVELVHRDAEGELYFSSLRASWGQKRSQSTNGSKRFGILSKKRAASS